jgi:pyruvate formate lyase activating enzyme
MSEGHSEGDDAPAAPSAAVRVGGLIRFSTSDWPGRLAAVLFLQGCPWHCGYCHNPHLLPMRGEHEEDWAATLAWLGTRRGLLDGVVFSGGEPTAQPGLAAAIRAVRAQGFAIGLHTGGGYPRRLAEVVGEVDWIGFDIKAASVDYAAVTGVRASGIAAFASLDLVLRSGVTVEIRTTVHPDVTSTAMLTALARELAGLGITHWVLQRFRPTGCATDALVAAAPRGTRLGEDLLAALAAHVPEIVVR